MEFLGIRTLLLLLAVLGGTATYQFFRGRRRNLELMRYSVQVLEELLKPRDKEYRLIGLYVGYVARYILEKGGVGSVEISLVLMPRQSLFYMPMAKLTTRFDKLFMFFRLARGAVHEAHVVRKGYYRLGLRREIKDFESMRVEEVVVKGQRYYVLYRSGSEEEAKSLLNFVEELRRPEILNHIATVPSTNSLYVATRYEPSELKELVEKAYGLAKVLAKKG